MGLDVGLDMALDVFPLALKLPLVYVVARLSKGLAALIAKEQACRQRPLSWEKTRRRDHSGRYLNKPGVLCIIKGVFKIHEVEQWKGGERLGGRGRFMSEGVKQGETTL